MKMRTLSILVVAVVLAATNVWAFGGGCGRGGGQGMGPGMQGGMGPGCGIDPGAASSLNLTADQQSRLRARQEAFQEQMIPLKEKMIGRRMELKSLWSRPEPDQAKIVAKQKEIQSLESQIQDKCTQYRFDYLKVLTPEQKEKLAATAGCPGAGWGGQGGHRGHGGGGMRCW